MEVGDKMELEVDFDDDEIFEENKNIEHLGEKEIKYQ